MGLLENLDLLSVGVAIAGIIVLGFTVYFVDRNSVTNKTFFLFTLITAVWGTLNYLSYKVADLDIAFWSLRFEISLAVWHTLLIFQLFYLFPKKKSDLPRKYYGVIIPIAVVTSLICLTPFVFSSVKETTPEGFINTLNVGPGMVLFAIFIISFIIAAFYSLGKKINTAQSNQEKRSLSLFFIGGILTFLPIIVFIFIFPTFLQNSRFIPFAALFIFPFILFTSYAILKHRLFNIKVARVGLLVFALSVTTFGEVVLFSKELPQIIYRSSVFILILVFGILLIKGVLREVEQREKIEVLAKNLEEANKQQETLIHFITHQVKGFLTKSKYIFAEIIDGTFGSISDSVKDITKEGLKVNTDGVTTIQTILHAANIKTGKMKLEMKLMDLKELVEKAFEKHKENAEEKGLTYNLGIAPGTYGTEGDSIQLNEALSNLIDNAIKYTPNGSIDVSLGKNADVIRFSVKDTGIGVAKEDMDKIFEEGQRGKDALKVNVDSTGFGLYIVKNIIKSHQGKVWVESEGEGKGSEFIVELPVK